MCAFVCFLKEIIRVFILIDHIYNLFVLRKQQHLCGSKDEACERNFKCFPDGICIWLIVVFKLTFSYRK